jgi:hypothetical protein
MSSSPPPLRWPGYARLLILASALAFVLLGTRIDFAGDTANSRLATVYSLVHDGTWFIDRPADQPRNAFEEGTIDKVQLNGRILSSKPPILPLLMTGEYVLLRNLAGLDLDRPEDRPRILWFMTVTLVGLAYLLALYCFDRTLSLFLDPTQRILPLFCLAFATQLPGLATDLNNHVPGAAMLVAAVYLALGMLSGTLPPHPGRFFLFGLCSALVFAIDMPLTIYVAIAGLALLVRFPRQAFLWGGAGSFLPLAIHFGVMLAVTGSPLPVQMRKELYLYEASPWRNPGGIDALFEPKPTYLFHMTFGRHGAFMLFPLLLLGFAGAALALVRPIAHRAFILAGFAAFCLLTLYYVRSTNNYGGAAYGFRWYVGSMPILLLMAVPLFQRLRGVRRPLLLLPLIAVSLYSAFESYRTPWGTDQEWTSRFLYGPTNPLWTRPDDAVPGP